MRKVAMGAGEMLVEIHPQELRFTFELKKQSSCSVQLVNKSKDFVAFKVKTTSPKRYCVRPNTGIILPRSTCDFIVIMQASKEIPSDMQLKDKFLIQTTVVPYGSMDEDIIPSFFSKETGRYIQENKLRVVLVSPPHSPEVETNQEVFKQDLSFKALDSADPIVTVESDSKSELVKEVLMVRETSVSNNGAATNEANQGEPILKETCIANDQELGIANFTPLHVAKDIDDLKLQLDSLVLKLNEAEKTIASLKEEINASTQERDKFKGEIALLRRYTAKEQTGFPFLFVVLMALVGMALGYALNS
ncbi:vesicle-associated protein 1-2-like [Zingiber officinale]|uniref:vesicle-associated protein 1-2-like n=1 Tax=Zingiber officinale TaxID=94328 RepID=UPI001C4D4696|nr:vesicle-associated protein 1-2-like [Zingiber officinale]